MKVPSKVTPYKESTIAKFPVVFPNAERSDAPLCIVVVHWDNRIVQELSQILFLMNTKTIMVFLLEFTLIE